jgi:formate hydrogenlyase subunit 6/NADH:ubiquinone oxidoreductase subunit I
MGEFKIYYFTGSGNSLYVAKELQKLVPGSELMPMVSLLNKDTIEIKAGTAGFVFPVHGMTIPVPVRKFFHKLDVSSAGYLFAIATRCGTWHNAFGEIDKILNRGGKSLDSCFTINMAGNDPKFKGWKPATEENLAKLESEAMDKLDAIRKIISGKAQFRENVDEGVLYPAGVLLKSLVLSGMFFMERTKANDYFYADAKCAGCGICEKVCPSRKVRMSDKKPVWQNDVTCFFCYACVNYCPKKSVQIKSKIYMKSYTEYNERYPHPYATVNDMVCQKEGENPAPVKPESPNPSNRETGLRETGLLPS